MTTLSRERLDRAYAACDARARSHYENFPVASRLLPPAARPHIAAVYAFARIADDIADEGTAPAGERQRWLQDWRARLHRAVDGADAGGDSPEEFALVATAHSIRTLDLPVTLFDDLLSAFAQDTTTSRYGSWADVLDYCRRSANPIGRLVLHITGFRDEALARSSDALCTALQLTNFWQDFGRDWRTGRLYVPREVTERCRASEADLAAGEMTPAWVAAIESCIATTRTLFAEGRDVCDGVRGRLRLELRLTWAGGWRVLDLVERSRARLLHHRPALGAADVPALICRAVGWRASIGC